MEKERFWFGLAVVALPLSIFCLPFLTPAPVHEDIRTEPFEGHVSIHGRPVTGGYIVFYPEDESSDAVASRIDPDGHYRIGPRWLRHRAKETPYRICLIPGTGNRARIVPQREIARVLDPSTTNLKVRLDAQSAEVDVNL